MRRVIAWMIVGWAGVGVLSCAHQATKRASATAEPTAAVVEIDLPKYQANLPEAPGREVFATACLSCHSTRYITMQPKLSAAKWEESVQKMIKTYGAAVAENQVGPIVQYLMTTKESGKTASWESLAVVPPSGAIPAVKLTDDPEMLRRGETLYLKNCASCHGNKGAGDGFSAPTLLPRPTDLRTGRYSAHALMESIYRGVPGTAMPAYANLPADDVRAVVAYTWTLTYKSDQSGIGTATEQGKSLFVQSCIGCHGADGAGDGIAAAGLSRRPTNFQQKRPTVEHALRVITEGVTGTGMPQWGPKMSEPERKALAEYVRGFYRGE